MWPRTSWPLSSLTRNIVFGRASVTSPSISIFSSLANGTAWPPARAPRYAARAGGPALDLLDVDCLRALVAGLLVIRDLAVLLERLEPLAVDAGVVDEEVTVALVRGDEPVALRVVE